MNSKNYDLNINIPVKEYADAVVAGAGSAGCFAAIQAARMGAKTILIEKNGILGGTTTTANVNFPGLFHAWGKQIIGGACWEAIERTAALGGAVMPDFSIVPERHWQNQVLVNRFVFASVLDEMCIESGVKLHLHTMPAHVEENEDGVIVVCAGKDGMYAIQTKAIIDATGDANIAGLLGYARVRSKFLQPGTLSNKLDGYDIEKVNFNDLKNRFNKALQEGKLFITDCQSAQNPFQQELYDHRVNMHITDIDASTSLGKTQAELKARLTLKRIVAFLKTVPGCENLQVTFVADECGIRETYRISGENTITSEDYLNGRVYDDSVCYSFYPIDLHLHDSSGIKQIFLEQGVVPTIPYGALIPKNSKRILTAGRCISGDTDANSAYRVQATCMATGQVAGAAAAIAAKENVFVKDVNYRELCKELTLSGAIVPNNMETK